MNTRDLTFPSRQDLVRQRMADAFAELSGEVAPYAALALLEGFRPELPSPAYGRLTQYSHAGLSALLVACQDYLDGSDLDSRLVARLETTRQAKAQSVVTSPPGKGPLA